MKTNYQRKRVYSYQHGTEVIVESWTENEQRWGRWQYASSYQEPMDVEYSAPSIFTMAPPWGLADLAQGRVRP